jgi:hypothetical protein
VRRRYRNSKRTTLRYKRHGGALSRGPQLHDASLSGLVQDFIGSRPGHAQRLRQCSLSAFDVSAFRLQQTDDVAKALGLLTCPDFATLCLPLAARLLGWELVLVSGNCVSC